MTEPRKPDRTFVKVLRSADSIRITVPPESLEGETVLVLGKWRLSIITEGWLGGKKETGWSIDRLKSIACVFSGEHGTTRNQDGIERTGGLLELRIELQDGDPLRLFRGRPEGELRWIAWLLRDAWKGDEGWPSSDPLQTPIARTATCEVCGGPMRAGVVQCSRCSTPHHEECWTYLGKCSVYACGETRFVRR